MLCIYNESAVFDWDKNNLRKIRAHRIRPKKWKKALSNDPIPIYEQDVEGEVRYVYYGETEVGDCWPSCWSSAARRSGLSPRTIWMPGRRRTTSPGGCEGSEAMKKKPIDMPKFANEAEEADWWASRQGREFVKQNRHRTRQKRDRAEGVAPCRPTEPERQRSDSAAIARS